MKQTKVLFLLYSLATGGAERRISSIANYLAGKGVEIQIALLDSPQVSYALNPQIKVVYLGADGAVSDASFHPVSAVPYKANTFSSRIDNMRLRVCRLLNRKQYKTLDSFLYLKKRYVNKIHQYLKKHRDFLVVSLMSFCNISTMAALMGLPNRAAFVECTDPNTEFSEGHPMRALKKKYYKRAQMAFFQTEEEASYYSDLTKTQKHVIPNPILCDLPLRYEGKRRPVAVNFCRLDKIKNIPLLIDAFALLSKDYPEYALHIYGEGREKENLMVYAAQSGCGDRIVFYDFESRVHEKIRDCAMFVSSSDREGISNSMLEAMAIGLPTVCTDCAGGGARMMIDDHKNGILVPMRDVQALCLAMKEVIENPELAERLSREAVKIKDRLTIENIGEQWYRALVMEENNE